MTATTTSPWLGNRESHWAREQFPTGTINEKQLRTLFSIEEGSRRIIDLDYVGNHNILKITDEITEIHTRFGQPRDGLSARPIYFWLNTDGKMLAAVEEKYEGPAGVHKPGDKFRKWAVAYLRHPSMQGFDKAIEIEYEDMWTLGHDGAVDKTRQYIRENWIES